MPKLEEKNLTQEFLHSIFEYNKEEGRLYWKISPVNSVKIGSLAGWVRTPKNALPRYILKIKGTGFIGARIIFFYHHGYWPIVVDHIDRDSINDKIENLRAATHTQNNQNRCSEKNSTSQYKGVHKIVCNGEYQNEYWIASIRVNGKLIGLGCFSFTKENEKLAALAYNKAAIKYFGEFANLNII